MNVILFLLLLFIFFIVLYVIYGIYLNRKKFHKVYFWGFGIASIVFAAIFDGIIDKIFIFLFSIFLVISRCYLGIFDT